MSHSHNILIFGMYSGEISQAYAIAKYFSRKGSNVSLALATKDNLSYFAKDKILFPIYFTPKFNDVCRLVAGKNFTKIVFCNSKSFKKEPGFRMIQKSPLPKTHVYCVDSNWLFNNRSIRYPFLTWADKYFINLPADIFRLGLYQNGGYFSIPQKTLEKIVPIGFIPSYKKITHERRIAIRKKLSVNFDQKLIFCYFSGKGAASRIWLFYNLLLALKKLNNDGFIKVVYVGDVTQLDSQLVKQHSWLRALHVLNLDQFYETLSSSDLIFQHQGLSTLAQGIAAQIPIIANVGIYPHTEYPGLHPAEIMPFVKLRLCKMFYRYSRLSDISDAIYDLLYNKREIQKMTAAQSLYNASGEEQLFQAIEETE